MKKTSKQSKKQSEASSIGEVAETFAEESNREYIASLERKNLELSEKVHMLTQALSETNVLLEHTKNLLIGSGSEDNGLIVVMPSDEELIIDLDIKRLKATAMERKLTLDEVKQLDLLVKNKKLAKAGNEPIDVEGKRLPANTDDKTLVLIASGQFKKKVENE